MELHESVINNDINWFMELLEGGVDPNIRNEYGLTVLHILCKDKSKIWEYESIEMVKKILSMGVEPNIQDNWGNTALHNAYIWGNKRIIRLLLEAGASPNIKNYYGQTVLHIQWHETLSMLKILLDWGAEPNIQDNLGYIPLHYLIINNGKREKILEYVRKGANPNIRDNGGRTSLFYGCKKGDKEIIRILLDAGASPNIGKTLEWVKENNKGVYDYMIIYLWKKVKTVVYKYLNKRLPNEIIDKIEKIITYRIKEQEM